MDGTWKLVEGFESLDIKTKAREGHLDCHLNLFRKKNVNRPMFMVSLYS